MRRAILAAVASLVVLTMSACGGGGNPPPPNNPMVTVSPATANVQEGSRQQFTATVTNTSDTAVTWQVNNITGGIASVGTITSGLVHGTGRHSQPRQCHHHGLHQRRTQHLRIGYRHHYSVQLVHPR